MRLVVDSVTATGFGSYGGPATLVLGGRGPVAIVGDNGAGKSTIASKALCWGLYGKAAPERMGGGTGALRGRDIVREGVKRTRVQVVLRSDRGDVYTVDRSREPKGAEQVVVSATLADGTTARLGNDQVAVDRLVGADYNVFTRTCVRGQNDPWNFAEATDAMKREILDAVSGAAALDAPFETAKLCLRQYEARRGVLRPEQSRNHQHEEQARLEGFRQRREQWETGREARVREAEQQAEQAEQAVATARAQDTSDAEAQVRRAEVQAREPTLERRPYVEAVEAATKAHTAVAVEVAAARQANERLARLIVAGKCSTCGQPTDVPGVHAEARQVPAEREAELAAWLASVTSTRDQADAWLAAAQRAWSAELAAFPRASAQPRAPALEHAAGQARQNAANLRAAPNPMDEAIDVSERAVQRWSDEADRLTEQVVALDAEIAAARTWVEVLAPKGVRAHLMEGALAAIEAEANRWLSALSEGRMSIVMEPTTTDDKGAVREEIAVRVAMGGAVRSLLTYSGGERRRVNLAVDLGVASVFGRGGTLAVSLLVLDEEVVSGLDERGKAQVLHALHTAGVADVVVVDHDPRLAAALPRSVMVTKGAGGSTLVESSGY